MRDLVSGVQRGDAFTVVELGTGGNDVISGRSATNDAFYVNGGMGDDLIVGSVNNDFLVGGAGNDTLSGLKGSDAFIGGGGNDVFVFTSTSGNDQINDFLSGTDKIDLRTFDIGIDQISSRSDGANTVIGIDTDKSGSSDFTITLLAAGRPADGDFLFA